MKSPSSREICSRHFRRSTVNCADQEDGCTSDDSCGLLTIVKHVDGAEQGLSIQCVVDWRVHHRIEVRLRIPLTDPAHVADRKLDQLLSVVPDIIHFLAIKIASLQPKAFNLDAVVPRDLVGFE